MNREASVHPLVTSLLSGCSLYCTAVRMLNTVRMLTTVRTPCSCVTVARVAGSGLGWLVEKSWWGVWRAVCHYCHYRLASYVIWSGPSTSTSTSTSTGPVATKELELERRVPLSTDTTALPPLCHILERAPIFCDYLHIYAVLFIY